VLDNLQTQRAESREQSAECKTECREFHEMPISFHLLLVIYKNIYSSKSSWRNFTLVSHWCQTCHQII